MLIAGGEFGKWMPTVRVVSSLKRLRQQGRPITSTLLRLWHHPAPRGLWSWHTAIVHGLVVHSSGRPP
jgi:hypothetical protein